MQRWEPRFYLPSLALPTDHTDSNTTSSIQNWLERLEEHNRLIVFAVANAQRAVDLILGSALEEENETTENAGDAVASGIPSKFVANPIPAIACCAQF